MKFEIPLIIDGRQQLVCIQFVKRGETVYVRRCAYTMYNPTSAQQAVRDTVALASSRQFGKKLSHIDDAVKFAFNGWVKTTEGRNRMQQALMAQYPKDTDAVKKYLKELKMV